MAISCIAQGAGWRVYLHKCNEACTFGAFIVFGACIIIIVKVLTQENYYSQILMSVLLMFVIRTALTQLAVSCVAAMQDLSLTLMDRPAMVSEYIPTSRCA